MPTRVVYLTIPLPRLLGHNLQFQFFRMPQRRQGAAHPHANVGQQTMQIIHPGHVPSQSSHPGSSHGTSRRERTGSHPPSAR